MNKISKNIKSKIVNISYGFIIFLSCGLLSCSDFLELQPTDKVTANNIFASDAGIEAFLANLYYQMPLEDFLYSPRSGFKPVRGADIWVQEASYAFAACYEDVCSNMAACTNNIGHWWEPGYRLNKDVNLFFSYIPTVQSISEDKRKLLYGEAYFLRALTYFTLARRYGGVPIITSISELTDSLALYKPRNTEKETWDFVLANCDSAAMNLGDEPGNGRRVNKWTALALKSRAALHVASIAKYWDRAPLSGRAVDAKLVGGFTTRDAQNYYQQCIDATEVIMNSGKYSLHKPNPANPQEAAENYRLMFENPNNALDEIIFIRGYDRRELGWSHDFDNWCTPMQTAGPWPHPARANPTLDLVDMYESYTNPGQSSPIITTTDGNTNDYGGYNASKTYLQFDEPQDIFKDKDARMHASLILPGSTWRDTKIVIQGGYIQPDGKAVIEADEKITVDGKTYYTYGGDSPKSYSGFDLSGSNYTRTGFLIRKFMNPTIEFIVRWNQCTTDWAEFRLAEVMLDYVEAVVESGQGDPAKAKQALNLIRKRAGHTVEIPLTLENVLRERKIELLFERGWYWELRRRRESHIKFDYNFRNHALVPVLDLRTMKYIFVRKNVTGLNAYGFTFRTYYASIPDVGTSGLIQNPEY